ncbi:L,D-transpeptidase family protein [Suttonella ornithocola]|uniref:Uncharacterized protein conserved in bacteria n=1 Tax=Suttonella ornithocola TaxID=279832 RepID=A0A380MXX0_9GAMM|nr:murein L,D-transpeptidase family protein [Suttonella ornithocola]SUO97132.1 Uncharacterized protein conserved in bacteria [Suttonella ornithocola]
MNRRWWLKAGALALAGCGVKSEVSEKKPDLFQQRLFVLPDEVKHLPLAKQMQARGFTFGAKTFIRIFKKDRFLEIWQLRPDGEFHLYQSFPICVYSGELGPKLREGDKQSPEGFYEVGLNQLNPNSRYHLSFNLGFPNAYDRAHGYTGKYLMVHGNCVSIGCYAMGDEQIEVIYAIVQAALRRGQLAVPVHVFPFHLTEENLKLYSNHRWYEFWRMLKPGYDYFEQHHVPPKISVSDKQYVVSPPLGEERRILESKGSLFASKD